MPILFIVCCVAVVYRQTAGNFFYSEDYVFLSIAIPNSVQAILHPLNPLNMNAIGFYRPISTGYYFILYKVLFGLQPAPFMITNLLLLVANVVLVFFLINRLSHKLVTSFFAAELYGVNFIHFEAVSVAAGIQELSFAFFSLITLLTYLIWEEPSSSGGSRFVWRTASLLSFVLALGSKETAVVIPLWLALYLVVRKAGKSGWHPLVLETLKSQWPYFLLTILYVLARLPGFLGNAINRNSLAAYDRTGVYAFQGFGTMFVHLTWFVRWILDEFLYPFQVAKDAVAPDLHLGGLAWAGVGAIASLALTAIALTFISAFRKGKVRLSVDYDWRLVTLGIGWFILAALPLSPWLFQPAYYLILPAVGAYLAVAILIQKLLSSVARSSVPLAIGIGFLIWLGTFWGAVERVDLRQMTDIPTFGKLNENALSLLRDKQPALPPGSTVYMLDFPADTWPYGSAEAAVDLFYGGIPVHVVVEGSSSGPLSTDGSPAFAVKYVGTGSLTYTEIKGP